MTEATSSIITGTSGSDSLIGTFGDDTMSGLGSWDYLYGRAGNDWLDGGDGDDQLDGEAGDDTLFGGAGSDWLYSESTGAGNDILAGWSGNDWLIARRQQNRPNDWVYMSGGDGNDWFTVQMYGGWAVADGGPGDDRFDLITGGTFTGGTGRDAYVMNSLFSLSFPGHPIVITDFATGAGGDTFDLTWITSNLSNWAGTNPFASGHLRLLQSASATLLQWDGNGGADNWSTLATFQNTNASQFTADNFGGYIA